MPTWGESYLQEFNQLVDVYEPAGIERVEVVGEPEDVDIETRRAEIEALRERVQSLTTEDLFSEDERATIEGTDSLGSPEEVAANRRDELDQCLRQTSEALADAASDFTTEDDLVADALEEVHDRRPDDL